MKNIAMSVSLAFLLLTLGVCVGNESSDQKLSSELEGFALNHQQVLKHLRTANEAAKEAVRTGHPPFGAVLVAPDGETVLMTQGNVSLMDHAETVIARQAFAKETLKNDPISLFPPLESVIFDLAARFNPFLGSFWVF